jgi:predicted CopG family antitoxin
MLEANVLDELMAKPRITITVSEEVYQILVDWADKEERPLANLVTYIVSKTAREYQQETKEQGQGG